MSEPRKNHLTIDGGLPKDDEHVATYKPIPEADTEFRSSKASLHKSKEKVDEAEEKLLEKEDEAKIVTRVDMADAKYVVGDHRNGDAKIELDANKRQFSGLTKEELMKYADDPFWIRLRWAMFILFWALWLCMLAGAIVIIVRTPKCAPPPPREWFEKYALIESDGGLPSESDLDLLHSSQVGGVFVQIACGADAYELLKTDTCLDQFKDFVAKAKDRGVKVIVDLIANYVPTTHEWFVKSQAREPGYEDYFIWRKPNGYNGTHPNPPNNWRAVTNEGAWTESEVRKELYLSQYGAGKADLNFRNPDVVKHFEDVLKAYMKAGAAGVRLSHARLLLVSASFEDDQYLANTDRPPAGATPTYGDYNFLRHNSTADQPELDALLANFSKIVDDNAASEPGAKKSVFTIKETDHFHELYLLKHNVSSLRPPSAAAISVDVDAAVLVNRTSLSTDRFRKWPVLQLTTAEAAAGAELAAFAYLLPAAPALSVPQLRLLNASAKSQLERLTALRAEESVQHGAAGLAAVPARNSTLQLVAVARWKPGHTGYLAVLNPQPEPLRADLRAARGAALPAQLTVHYVSHEVANLTGYVTNKLVDCDDVMVPAKSTVVLSFALTTAE